MIRKQHCVFLYLCYFRSLNVWGNALLKDNPFEP